MNPIPNITERTIRQMVADFLYRDPADIGPEDDFEDDLGLDSLDRFDLLTLIESRYQLAIDDSLLTEVANFGQLMSVLEQARTR